MDTDGNGKIEWNEFQRQKLRRFRKKKIHFIDFFNFRFLQQNKSA